MPNRINIFSGAKWEALAGYSRAVRVGNVVEVAGTTAVDESGQVVGLNDAFTQTQFILKKIEKALVDAGATLEDVTRTRIFTTNMAYWEAISRAHGESFAHIRPASTLVAVHALIAPDLLVEIEATAMVVR
jgi:enamine deaminase RidA (YjgF/YER057c/UK114 family)